MRDLGDRKGYFTATILSRGEEYYQRGEVCHIYKREDGYEARVQGCELYNVRIMTDEREVPLRFLRLPVLFEWQELQT